jgi:hypothetical protein
MSIGKFSLVIIAGNFRAELPSRQRRAAGAVKPGGTIEWPPALARAMRRSMTRPMYMGQPTG